MLGKNELRRARRPARYTHGRQSLGAASQRQSERLSCASTAMGMGMDARRPASRPPGGDTGCWSGGWCSFGGFSLPMGRKLWRTRTVGACTRTADFHCPVKPFFLDRCGGNGIAEETQRETNRGLRRLVSFHFVCPPRACGPDSRHGARKSSWTPLFSERPTGTT